MYETLTRNSAAICHTGQRGGPLALWRWRDREEAYRVPAAPLTSSLQDPRVLAFLLVWFGVNLLFGLVSVSQNSMFMALTLPSARRSTATSSCSVTSITLLAPRAAWRYRLRPRRCERGAARDARHARLQR